MTWKETLRDWRLYVFGGLFLFNLCFVLAFAAPRYFPAGNIITIKKGASLAALSHELEKQNVVRSALWFRAAVITMGGERGVQAGDYNLRKPQNAVTLAWRMVRGSHDLTLVKVTIPEGYKVSEIAPLFDERFPFFDKDIFKSLAPEGYMFPDTYFIQINATAGSVIELMQSNFDKKIATLEKEISDSKRSKDEIIRMASVIEAEVQTERDKRLVSGILWKRISIGMPLQVDAAPDTYRTAGLPPKPINNPGLVSIKAAANPETSPYLYFLSDKEGNTHYAKTLEEHTRNIQKYL
ncbi:endolytic transglycosylase MltG [Candidatus Parcubacteria bacterium]|nr:endolytic transglycosylase MltG [Candidatus Parcubacteria bacterium]